MVSTICVDRRRIKFGDKDFKIYDGENENVTSCIENVACVWPARDQHMLQHHATMLQDVGLKCCERLARPLHVDVKASNLMISRRCYAEYHR